MSRIDDAINEVWETSSELLANDARAELATLRLEHDALIAMGKQCASLRADLQAAQERISELTQDDRYCPLCTWRGPVELVNGVCPQCDVDWPKEYREHRNALIVAQERIVEMARQLDAAREIMSELRGVSVREQLPSINAWLAANPAPESEQQP